MTTKKFLQELLYFNPVGAEIEVDTSAKFACKVDARPTADIQWFKDDQPLTIDENIKTSADSSELIINRMKPENAGHYTCTVSNVHKKRDFKFHIGISGLGMFIA